MNENLCCTFDVEFEDEKAFETDFGEHIVVPDADAVRYTPQSRTDEEKARARKNIGAVSADEVPAQVQPDWAENDDSSSSYIKNKPLKLSDFENDLFYVKRESFLTLTKDDFIVDEEQGGAYYKGTPKLDWLNSAEDIGFSITMTNPETNESQTMTDNEIPFNHVEKLSDEMIVVVNNLFTIVSGFDALNEEDLVPEDAYYIALNAPPEALNMITHFEIFRLSKKLIPEDVLDLNNLKEEFAESINDISVQSDWNQNDKSKLDYVKNKPFGYEIKTTFKCTKTRDGTTNKPCLFTSDDYAGQGGPTVIYYCKFRGNTHIFKMSSTANGSISDTFDKFGFEILMKRNQRLNNVLGTTYLLNNYDSNEYPSLSIYEFELGRATPQLIDSNLLPTFGDHTCGGVIVRLFANYDDTSYYDSVIGNTSGGLFYKSSYQEIYFFEQFNSNASRSSGVIVSGDNKSKSFGLNDDDFPMNYFYIQTIRGEYSKFLLVSNNGKIYECSMNARTETIISVTLIRYSLPQINEDDTGKFLKVSDGGVQWSDDIIIKSSTEGSTKKFRLTVDDSGVISATEVV